MPGLFDFSRMTTDGLGNTTAIYDDSQRAVMYIIRPRQVPDGTVRPYQFNFSPQLYTQVESLVGSAAMQSLGSIGGNYTISSRMVDVPDISKAIAPTAVGHRFDGRFFDNCYTFLLTVDNATFEGRTNPTALSNRLLYTGYFTDEPVIQGAGGVLIFNESCMMVITHSTHINVKNIHTPTGILRQSQPMSDMDILQPDVIPQITQGREYLLRPSDLVKGITVQDGGAYEYFVPESGNIGMEKDNIRVNTHLNAPKEQLSNIVMGIAKTVSDSLAMDSLSSPNPAMSSMSDSTMWYETLRSNMSDTDNVSRFIGLNTRTPMLIGDVLAKYPILRSTTQILNVPWALPEQPMDDSGPNAINIWSSLLMSAVPSVLVAYGISDATFRYDSRDFNAVITTFNTQPVCEVFDIQTFIPEEDINIQKTRWEQALKHLEKQVFSIIIEQCGHFTANIRYSSARECAVQLNLPEFTDVINDGVVINNKLFGGMYSPLVGSEALRNRNSGELAQMSELINNSVMYSKFSQAGSTLY